MACKYSSFGISVSASSINHDEWQVCINCYIGKSTIAFIEAKIGIEIKNLVCYPRSFWQQQIRTVRDFLFHFNKRDAVIDDIFCFQTALPNSPSVLQYSGKKNCRF